MCPSPLAIGGLSCERTVAGGVAVGFGVLVSTVGVAGVVDEIDVGDERPGPQAGVPRVGGIEGPAVHMTKRGASVNESCDRQKKNTKKW